MRLKLRLPLTIVLLVFLNAGFDCCAFAQQKSKPGEQLATSTTSGAFESSVRPIVAKYCVGCHGPAKPKGGLNLATFQDERSARKERKVWARVREYVEGGVMPPEDRPQPSHEEAARLVQWIKSATTPDDCGRTFDPGHVTIRRLNRGI